MSSNILIIDDEISCITSIELMIDKNKYNILKSETGRQALQFLLSDQPIDIILLDLMMPELDGISLLKIIKEAKLNLSSHIIIQTACIDIEQIKLAFSLGASAYLLKPFSREDLDNCLESVLKKVNNSELTG